MLKPCKSITLNLIKQPLIPCYSGADGGVKEIALGEPNQKCRGGRVLTRDVSFLKSWVSYLTYRVLFPSEKKSWGVRCYFAYFYAPDVIVSWSSGRQFRFSVKFTTDYLYQNLIFFQDFIYFQREGKGRRKGERHRSVASRKCPNLGLNPKSRHVPLPGIEPVTFRFVGWRPANWATPIRACIKIYNLISTVSIWLKWSQTWKKWEYIKS